MTIIAHAKKALFGHREAAQMADELTPSERQLLLASFREGIGRRPSGPEFEHHLSLVRDKLKGTPNNVIR